MREMSPYEGSTSKNGMACLGVVVSVDKSARLLRVKTIGMPGTDDLDLYNVRVIHGFWHADGDESVALPRIKSFGVVLFVGSDAFWLGSTPLPMSSGGGQRKNMEAINEGDWIAKTVYGNKIILRTGGTIEIQSTNLCKVFWIPSQNLISAVCQNLEIETSGGHLKWTIDKENNNTTNLRLKAWNNLNPTNAVVVDIGTVSEDNNEEDGNIKSYASDDLVFDFRQGSLKEDLGFDKRSFRMSLKKDGSVFLDVGPGKFTMTVDAATGDVVWETKGSVKGKVFKDVVLNIDGEVKATVKKDITLNVEKSVVANVTKDMYVAVKGNVSVAAGGNATMSAKGDATVTAKGSLKASADGEATVSSKASAKVEAPTVDITGQSMVNVDGGMVNLAGGGAPVARVGDTAIGTGNYGAPVVSTILIGSPKVTSG